MTETEWFTTTDTAEMIRFLGQTVSERKLLLVGAAACRSIWSVLQDSASQQAVALSELLADGEVNSATIAALTEEVRNVRANLIEVVLPLEDEHDRLLTKTAKSSRPQWPHSELWVPQRLQASCAESAAAAVLWLIDTHAGARGARTPASLAAERSTGAVVTASIQRTRLALASANTIDSARWKDAEQREEQLVANLLRDIVGNPFRPLHLAPDIRAWHDGTIAKLASATYEQRALPSGHLDPERLAICADGAEEAGAPEELLAHLRGPGPHVRGCHAIDLLSGRM